MHSNDLIPQFVFHIGKSFVPQNASVVDQNVDPTVSINRRLDDSVSILSRGPNPYGLATVLLDFLNHIVRVNEIVDNNRGTQFGEEKGVRAAKPIIFSGRIVAER